MIQKKIFDNSLLIVVDSSTYANKDIQMFYESLTFDQQNKVDQYTDQTAKTDQILKYTLLLEKKTIKQYPYHSVSHSGQFIGCLYSTKQVGLDIQEINDRFHQIKINRLCCQNEWKQWRDSPLLSDRDRFYYLWTAKESLFKVLSLSIQNEIKTMKNLVINYTDKEIFADVKNIKYIFNIIKNKQYYLTMCFCQDKEK